MKTHNISKICAALGCAFALSSHTVALASTDVPTIQDAASLAKGFSAYNINEVIGFTGDNQLIPKHQVNLGNGMFKTRFVQHYQGIPIFGHSVAASQSAMGLVFDVKGQVVNFDNHQLLTKPRLSAKAMMQKLLNDDPALQKLSSKAVQAVVSNKSNQLFIYMQDDKPLLVHRISYKVQGETGEPAIPVYFVDAHSGKIVLSYDNLQHAKIGTGPGGNDKIGIYQYGSDFDFLDVNQDGQTCTMENANVKTIDLNHSTSGSEAFSFTCPENTSKPINGAASPLNDGHYFGNMVYDMYNDYIGESPLTFQMCVKVHYGNNHENAFWDGTCMTFGDGGSTFYPLVVLDLMSHEVSHGFSGRHANFVFFGHSGSINESFSDLAGEAAEYYMKGINDWLVAAEIFKSDGALRYLQDPTLDGRSIDHASDFTSGTDVHNGSGVYNKAFYLLANTPGWDTRMAFKTAGLANMMYWNAIVKFDNGVCGLQYAAADLGYNPSDVTNAFTQVGANCLIEPPMYLQKGVPVALTGNKDTEYHNEYHVPADVLSVSFDLSGGAGDADLYVKFGALPTTSDYDCRPYKSSNNESCHFGVGQTGTYYVMVKGYANYSDASLVANHTTYNDSHGEVKDIELAKYEFKYWPINLDDAVTSLDITISGGTGDADLYVKQGSQPSNADYDCRPYKTGNDETCSIANAKAGAYFIGIKGYTAVSGLTLQWDHK